MKTPTEHLVDEVKNWSFDDWKILRDDPKLLSSILSSVQKAAPEVFENVLCTVMIPPAMNNPEVNSILGEWKMEKEPEEDDNHFGEEQAADLKKELGTEGDNNDTGTPYQSREEVPEQARELWDIMHGLRDDPHDDRWED